MSRQIYPHSQTTPQLRQWTALAAVITLTAATRGDEPPVRDLEADRPDATESPVTVDKGFFQVESSFFSYSRDKNAGTEVETYGIAESNVKYGLLDNTDLQVVFTPYLKETTRTATTKDTVEDFGDVTFRVKYNMWGNDAGETAMAVMPFVKIPTQTEVSNGHWEGGVILPFAWRAGERWGVGLQGEVDRVFNESDRSMDWDFAHTAVIGFDVTDRAGIYVEYLGIAGDHPYQSYFSSGATFTITERVRLDAGTVIGLTDAAEDFAIFNGITFKF